MRAELALCKYPAQKQGGRLMLHTWKDIYENAGKSPQQQFEGNTTMSPVKTIEELAPHKVAHHHPHHKHHKQTEVMSCQDYP
jgi:hypothetical protein